LIQALVHSLKIVTIVATAVLVAFGGRSFFDYYTEREADPRLGQPFLLEVAADDDADSLAAELNDRGLIRSELVFKTEMRLTSDVLQPGFYTLRYGMSVREIIDVITVPLDPGQEGEEGEQPAARLVEITTIEGWRLEQIAEEYSAAGLGGGYEGFLAATHNISTRRYGFLQDRPEGASLEGYLFPNTYQFGSNAAPEDVIYLMLDAFDAEFTPQMRKRAQELGMTIHQVVTLASIVERETGLDEERPRIAAVYLNRLAADMTLDADPTVVYALGNQEEWWAPLQPDQQHSAEVADNPYNTYTQKGLPPGPICNPSAASIKAVLNAEEVDFLYFVATGDGGHVFANTYEEHLANVEQYQNGG